jgi:hypothetical protein
MHLADRRAVEAGLRNLISRPSAGFTALDVFSTIAHALTVAIITERQEDGGDLLTAYVADVEKVWRRAGFRPSRVRNASKSKYRGPYHRFLELVLIDQFDPISRQFDPLGENDRRDNWLISEHYLRTVRMPIEKTVLKTP